MSFVGGIPIKPGMRSGKPRIRGLRITTYDTVEYLAAGIVQEKTLREFPFLEADDLRARLETAADRPWS